VRSKSEGYSFVKVSQRDKFNVKVLIHKLSCTSGPNFKALALLVYTIIV